MSKQPVTFVTTCVKRTANHAAVSSEARTVRVHLNGREHLVDIEYQVRGTDTPTREPLTTLTGATHTPEHWKPIRGLNNRHGKQSRPGIAWIEDSQQLAEYESRLESTALLLLEFEGGLHAVTPQPFRMYFRASQKPANHVPDFFVRYTDGRGVVVNVKPAERLDSSRTRIQFEATERACAQTGWEHRVITSPSDAVRANLSFLAGYRRAPIYSDVVLPAAFDAVTTGPVPLRVVAHEVSTNVDLPRPLVLPALFHAMWQRELEFHLADFLDHHTHITLPKGTP